MMAARGTAGLGFAIKLASLIVRGVWLPVLQPKLTSDKQTIPRKNIREQNIQRLLNKIIQTFIDPLFFIIALKLVRNTNPLWSVL
tara:strand:- start:138 stop:392 length:255 start_codon:yes stop_codon:yes gene_type:complete